MSANFWCWVPALALLPGSPDFMHRVDVFDNPPTKPPAPAIVRFVNDLTRRYPDLSDTEENTPWADGPMIRDANGGFINFSMRWDYYDKVTPFVTSTAQHDGLNCFDPQTSEYYPALGKPYVIAKLAVVVPVTNANAAIKKARYICRLAPNGNGQWNATRADRYWHVWFGPPTGGGCGYQSAEVAKDGSTTSCVFMACRNK